MKLYNTQQIHKIAKANDIMYPDYRDTKPFLKILILLGDTTENGKIFQTTTACEKKGEIKRVCVSLGLQKDERMCVSGEVICARLVYQGCIWEVDETMENLYK